MSFLSDREVNRLQAAASEPPHAGERYLLGRELGRGGMGRVWLAHDETLGRDVALKVLEAAHEQPELEARMRNEAHILARLEHPGVVPVHDLGRTADGRLFYAMKRVEGETLDVHVEHVGDRAERLRIFERLCDPVAFAHARGIVHRDLKPTNVMVGSFGEVLVMDWGVARLLTGGADAAIAPHEPRATGSPTVAPSATPPAGASGRVPTEPGTVLGTRGFMPPEQERGEPVDARADVYALGAILLRLLADAPTVEGAPPPLGAASSVPRPLRAIVAKAMAPRASDRYPDAAVLADEIARYRDARPVAAYRENVPERLARWAARYRVALLLVAAYLVMRAMVALWLRQRPVP